MIRHLSFTATPAIKETTMESTDFDTRTLVAIDPSLTGMAVCVWKQEHEHHCLMQRLESKPCGDSARDRLRRYNAHAKGVIDIIRYYCPGTVLIEGYSYASNGSVIALGEFGGILRLRILEAMAETGATAFYEVAPSTLKKFTTGKGNGNKEAMAAHVQRQWNQIFRNNDETDAYALGQLGRHVVGWVPCTNNIQREAVAAVLGTKTPKVKRSKVA